MTTATPATAAYRLVLVEDHSLLRENLKMGLELKGGHTIVATCSNGKELLQFLEKCPEASLPHLILMDVGMPEMDGLEATYQLKKKWPQLPVLMITSYNDAATIQNAFRVKAHGYCTKETALDELQQAMHTVVSGYRWLDYRVARTFLPNGVGAKVYKKEAFGPQNDTPDEGQSAFKEGSARLNSGKARVNVESVLNARELQILKLVAENASNDEIANKLKLSEAWISGYIENIISKLAVNNEVEAVELALESRFLDKAPLLQKD